MPTDLFTQPSPAEDAYRELLQRQWEKDNRFLSDNQIAAPWQHRESVLDRDEYKLLTLIADTAGGAYYGGKDRATLATALGFLSTGNLEAVVKKCVDRDLVRMVTSGARIRICMTEYGRDQLDDSEDYDDWDMVLGDGE